MVGASELEGVEHAILTLLQVAITIQCIAGLAAHEVLDKTDLQADHAGLGIDISAEPFDWPRSVSDSYVATRGLLRSSSFVIRCSLRR